MCRQFCQSLVIYFLTLSLQQTSVWYGYDPHFTEMEIVSKGGNLNYSVLILHHIAHLIFFPSPPSPLPLAKKKYNLVYEKDSPLMYS